MASEPIIIDDEPITIGDRRTRPVFLQVDTPPRAAGGNWGPPPKPWRG